MNPVRKKRLTLVVVLLAGFSVAVTLALIALQENINLFYSPTEIEAGEAPEDRRIRAGGLVEYESVNRDPDSLLVRFRITDHIGSVPVEYVGILPDLFREGQGVVALGTVGSNGVFTADQVLAKHDEEYMPPEVAEALERAAHFKGKDKEETEKLLREAADAYGEGKNNGASKNTEDDNGNQSSGY